MSLENSDHFESIKFVINYKLKKFINFFFLLEMNYVAAIYKTMSEIFPTNTNLKGYILHHLLFPFYKSLLSVQKDKNETMVRHLLKTIFMFRC